MSLASPTCIDDYDTHLLNASVRALRANSVCFRLCSQHVSYTSDDQLHAPTPAEGRSQIHTPTRHADTSLGGKCRANCQMQAD
jgi:hypothetical protein